MAWKEERGAGRAAVAGAHTLAHSDDAKSRVHEATKVAGRSWVKPLVAGVAGVVLVVGGVVVAQALTGGDDGREPAADQGSPSVRPTPTPSPTPSTPTPEEILDQSQPAGTWKLTRVGKTQTERGGRVKPFKFREQDNNWTFATEGCTDEVCRGTVSSTSGNTFSYVWDGDQLVVKHPKSDLVSREEKVACYDRDTGEILPIEESAARYTYHYSYSPFTGSATELTGTSTVRIDYEFFGTCTPDSDDIVEYAYEWRLHRLDAS